MPSFDVRQRMIQIQITKDEIQFSAENSVHTYVIRMDDYPMVFRHPRMLVSDPDAAAAIIKPELKKFTSWRPHKVEIQIRYELVGGLTEVDKRILKEAFIFAGARDAVVKEPNKSGEGTA
jgi:hypothetical protein